MAFPWSSWFTWITVILHLTVYTSVDSSISPSTSTSSYPLITGECLYQECAVNPLSECYFSSDYLIDCETRESCQRIIVYKIIPESPVKENLSISVHSYSLRPNTSIDLTLDISYLLGSHLKTVALQSFKCRYQHENGTVNAIMTGFNETQVYGDALYTGESIHCQWIISLDGPLWPRKLIDGQPLNIYNHVFACNKLSINSSLVYTFTHSPPLHRLRYITDTLYPNNRLPFNPCELSQTLTSTSSNPKQYKPSKCSGQAIIVPNHQDETYLDIYLIVYDPITSISLQLKHSTGEQRIGLLRCRYNSRFNIDCSGTYDNPGFIEELDNSLTSSSSSLPLVTSISDDYQLGSVEASPLFNSTGLRAFWRVPVSFAQLWNSKGSDGVNFLLDITINLESGEEHSTRGTIKVPLTSDYPSPFDHRKCSNSDSSTTSSLFPLNFISMRSMFTIMVLVQLFY